MGPEPYLSEYALSLIVFMPLLFGLLSLLIPAGLSKVIRPTALMGSLIVMGLSVVLWFVFDGSSAHFQFEEMRQWLPALGASYHLGVDGISLPLVVFTALLFPVAILGTWPSKQQEVGREKLFVFLLMFLETGVLGAFLALDIFLFYIFFEAMLIPMYFLIGIWGGKDRIYATMKFFIYTLFGSLMMLVAIFYLIYSHDFQWGFMSAAIQDLVRISTYFDSSNVWSAITSPQGLLFLAFALAFCIKIPMFPLHTWLPDAHVQAPTIGSVLLAGILLKLGTYGLLRFALPLFPEAAIWFAPFFFWMGVIGIVYGALLAMVQKDIKKLVAYSSVSHMGFILIGIFTFNAQGMAGAVYQMVNHGIATGGLFLVVGFLYERLHTRDLEDFGGLAKIVPAMAVCFLIIILSSAALPLTNGFVGEFLILLGAFRADVWVAAFAGLGVILGAVYLLNTYQKVMLGPMVHESNRKLPDLYFHEWITMVILIFFVAGIGFFPQAFFGKSQASIEKLVSSFQGWL
jgi:NADH-quinone oxidoreductase subunit M